MKLRTKQILSISYLALVFSVTLILAVTLSKEGKGLFSIIGSINIYWLGAAFLCIMLYIFFETLTVRYITSFMYGKMPFLYILKIDLIGNYYGALTPAAVGFMPAQIAYLKRDGVPVGISTFIQILKQIAYEVVIVFFCLIFMLVRGGFFYSNNSRIFWLSIFGAFINVFVIIIMVLAIKNPIRLKKMALGTARFLAKIRIVKNAEKMTASTEKTLGDFHDSAQYISKYKWKAVYACLLTLLQWLMFFIIPYCLYNAFGLGLLQGNPGPLGSASPLGEAVTIVAMAAFLFLAVHFMPVPGSSGATEAGFGIFFGSFFFDYSIAAMFIWRLITYYSLILTGFIVIVADKIFQRRKVRGA